MATTKSAATKKPPTKSEIFGAIAEATGLSKKQVASVFDALGEQIKKNLGSRGPGVFAVPGLCKMVVKKKPATKGGKRINPFTKEEMIVKPKPASKTVRVRPLKNLKEMVA